MTSRAALAASVLITAACTTNTPKDGDLRSDDATAAGAKVAPSAATRDTVPSLRPTVIVPSTDTMTFVSLADGRPDTVAVSIQTFRRTSYRGRDAWEQAFAWRRPDGSVSADTTYFSPESLLPLGQIRHGERQDVVVTYSGARVHIVVRTSDAESVTDTTLAVAPFSSSQSDAVLRALPLSAGFEASLPFYYIGPIGLRSMAVRVVGQERIRTRAGAEADCWIVELETVGARSRYWIAKDSRRFLKLVDYDPSGGQTLGQ